MVIGLDETLERRWGNKIAAKGIYRDPVRSSHVHFVKASGLRWVCLMLLVPAPWASRVWALPFLSVLAPSERYAQERGKPHKKLTDWSRQMLLAVALVGPALVARAGDRGRGRRSERGLEARHGRRVVRPRRARPVEVVSETAVWYHAGLPPVPLRWVLVRDPQGAFATQALLSMHRPYGRARTDRVVVRLALEA